eukprot:3864256-Prymnesium_polylepis.1
MRLSGTVTSRAEVRRPSVWGLVWWKRGRRGASGQHTQIARAINARHAHIRAQECASRAAPIVAYRWPCEQPGWHALNRHTAPFMHASPPRSAGPRASDAALRGRQLMSPCSRGGWRRSQRSSP